MISHTVAEKKSRDEEAVSSGASSQGSTTPQSDQSVSPKTASSKPYQATVEDDGEEETHRSGTSGVNNDAKSDAKDQRQSSPVIRSSSLASIASNSSVTSQASFSSASDQDPVLKGTSLPTPPCSPIASNRKAGARVHFSPRPPPRLHQSRSLGAQGSPETMSPLSPPAIPEIRHPQNTSKPRTPPDGDVKSPELSAVDLKWGRLFSGNGLPTKRLTQVLHGVANYLVGLLKIGKRN
jgi:hypothetical protein